MVHTFLISKHYYNYYNYCRVGTVFDDALPVNVTLNEQKKKKKSYYLVNVLPNIIDYSTYSSTWFSPFP